MWVVVVWLFYSLLLVVAPLVPIPCVFVGVLFLSVQKKFY
jgi:hypothetical protein